MNWQKTSAAFLNSKDEHVNFETSRPIKWNTLDKSLTYTKYTLYKMYTGFIWGKSQNWWKKWKGNKTEILCRNVTNSPRVLLLNLGGNHEAALLASLTPPNDTKWCWMPVADIALLLPHYCVMPACCRVTASFWCLLLLATTAQC